MNNIWQKIVLAFLAVVAFFRSLGWSRQTWTRIIIWAVFLLIFMVGVRSCSRGGATGNSGVGNGIWILMIGGLITAAVRSKERPYLAWSLTGLAALIFLVLLGKFDTLFTWSILGLPLFAATGFWGSMKADGRARSFLGFASGIITLYWLFLFYQGHPIGDTGFIGTEFFSNNTAKSIFVVFVAMFLFATWKRSKIAYLISFIVFLSFLGNGMVGEIFNRFPEKLTPKISVSEKTKSAWEKIWNNLLETATGEKAKAGLDVNIKSRDTTGDEAKITEAMAKDKITVFPATIEIIGGKLGHRSINVPKGKYAVYPPDTEVNLGEGRKVRDGGLFEVLNDHQWIGLHSPTGQSKITIIQE